MTTGERCYSSRHRHVTDTSSTFIRFILDFLNPIKSISWLQRRCLFWSLGWLKQNKTSVSHCKSSYIAQYPVLRTVQSALHFTSLTDLFTKTPSRLLWETSSHMLQLMHEGCSYTYPPLSIARYSFIQLSELEQCRVTKLAQGFNTAAQDSNPGSHSRESETLPLSHCALYCHWAIL